MHEQKLRPFFGGGGRNWSSGSRLCYSNCWFSENKAQEEQLWCCMDTGAAVTLLWKCLWQKNTLFKSWNSPDFVGTNEHPSLCVVQQLWYSRLGRQFSNGSSCLGCYDYRCDTTRIGLSWGTLLHYCCGSQAVHIKWWYCLWHWTVPVRNKNRLPQWRYMYISHG